MGDVGDMCEIGGMGDMGDLGDKGDIGYMADIGSTHTNGAWSNSDLSFIMHPASNIIILTA